MGDLVAFLNEAARYFEGRDSGGEDKAHWANVANAENCRKAADEIEKLRRERDEARGWAKDWHNIVDLTCTVIGLGVLDAHEVVEAVRDKFAQAERRATSAEAKIAQVREALQSLVRLSQFELDDNADREPWKRVLEKCTRALAAREGAHE